MTDSPLFELAPATPPLAAGAYVTTPNGSQGRIVAPDPVRGGWWLVKLSGGSIVAVDRAYLS